MGEGFDSVEEVFSQGMRVFVAGRLDLAVCRGVRARILLLTLLLVAGFAAVLFFLPWGDQMAFLKGSARSYPEMPDLKTVPIGKEVEEKPGDVLEEPKTKVSPAMREMSVAETLAAKGRLREMQRTDDEGLEVVTMPDGHQSIDLKGRFHHVTRLVVAADGSVVPVCGAYFPGEVAGE